METQLDALRVLFTPVRVTSPNSAPSAPGIASALRTRNAMAQDAVPEAFDDAISTINLNSGLSDDA